MRSNLQKNQSVSNFTFWLYIYFVIDFFLHLSARIPGYGVIRPTILWVLLLTTLLVSQKDKFSEVTESQIFKSVNRLILYIIITFFFVSWPGSVLANIPDFVKAIVFFYYTALIIDQEKRLKIFIFIFIGSQLFRVLEPLYMNVTDGYWGDKTHLGGGEFAARLSGAPVDVINPNGLGFVIVTLIPYLYNMAWQSSSKILKLFSLCVFPLLIYTLILTMSRGSFIVLCVALWFIFKESKHKIIILLLISVSTQFIWSNLSFEHKDRYLSLFTNDSKQSTSAQGRFSGMGNEFAICLERPVVGHGLGTTPESKVHAGYRRQAAHNLYAEVLVELGVLGFILFMKYLVFVYQSIVSNKNLIKGGGSPEDSLTFKYRLNQCLISIFWIYLVFSINYFGLSVYYWYMYGGLTVAFTRIYFSELRKTQFIPEIKKAGRKRMSRYCIPLCGQR